MKKSNSLLKDPLFWLTIVFACTATALFLLLIIALVGARVPVQTIAPRATLPPSSSIPPTPATPLRPVQRYTVKQGDTLWGIAQSHLGTGLDWPQLWHLNPGIRNPNLIYPGEKLTL